MERKIIVGSSGDCETQVNQHLKDGWLPSGNRFSSYIPSYGIVYVQIVIKDGGIALDAKYAKELESKCFTCDGEDNHIAGDDTLVQLLRELGFNKTCDMYEKISPKWYG